MTSSDATYIFCLVQAARTPRVRGVPSGVPGAGPPRALVVGPGVWAIVADAPLEYFSSDALQKNLQDLDAISRHALGHAAVVEYFFRRSPVIPLKLFTIFSNDERARADLGGKLPRIRRLFAQLRGREEWAVRVVAGEPPRRPAPVRSGRDYLERKRQLQHEKAAAPRSVAREANSALTALGKLAVRAKREVLPASGRGSVYATGASFLVDVRQRTAWKKKAASVAAALGRRGHRLDLSGPWPPYHFVSRS